MSDILLLPTKPKKTPYHFAVYELLVEDKAKNVGVHRLIVIKNQYGVVVRFTGLEAYSHPFTGRKTPIRTRSKQELGYICDALNYIFFNKKSVNKVASTARVTLEIIIDYFENYRTEPMDNGRFRGQQSVDKCVWAVSHFFANVSLAAGTISAIEPTELFIEKYEKANKESRKLAMKFTPIYQQKALQKREKLTLRDIPISAMEILWDVCRVYCPEIYFIVVAQCTAGLRPSEALNMRREDSLWGRGLSITMHGSTIKEIEIDLEQELMLRSDGKSVGRIKRERKQKVYPAFISLFNHAYEFHKHYLQGRRYETEFAPMFINRDGKAMAYKSYLQKFQSLVRNYLRPRLLESEKPELHVLAHRLATENLSPHALRHFFTVLLVMRGEDIAQIQHFRGDKNPESALDYLQNKGELVKAAEVVATEFINRLLEIGKNIDAHE